MSTTLASCEHRPRVVAGVEVIACGDCGEVSYMGGQRRLDPAEGLARLFGVFDLAARLPAVGAPAPEVLAYTPPSRRARSHLAAFPPGVWLEAAPELWLSHDGETLVLAPQNPLYLDNMAGDIA